MNRAPEPTDVGPNAIDADAAGGVESPPLSTGFGSFGGFEPARESSADMQPERSAFDVCHVGVVLRAVLFLHGVLALGAAFVARDVAGWGLLLTEASGVGMPALLCWLLTACLAQRRLARLPIGPQWVAATLAGAAWGLAAWWLWGELQWAASPRAEGLRTLAVAATGAAMAAAFFHWLRQRARLERPAATTARLAELQSRIRPHFLFNTLNTAIALVRIDPSRAEAVLEDLAELFRVALGDTGAQAAASLRDEVELARRYLAIEQIRFGERLQVRWEIDPQADGARLPPLLLQPLVENAVKHGIEPSPRGGTMRVRTRVRRGQVEILVANSVPQQASVPGHGMALRNVRERLRLMHDVAADFRAGRDGDVYRVQIVVPL
ncbi:histidine kinase [uncultured Methylibium sp.]|uniref:sensor histidine kinase n=1 Tax=uncultured Methylibium sp. TaxID=381093 RepID=UPI0025F92DFD|nr:histidine kinase [uncultured Methylibium sp.]